jgi:hypothetical protein
MAKHEDALLAKKALHKSLHFGRTLTVRWCEILLSVAWNSQQS